MTEERDAGADSHHRKRDRLPSKPSAGELVGGILAGVEHMVTARPRPPAQIEEPYRDEWASIEGVTIEGLDEPRDHPEPPDRSGARV